MVVLYNADSNEQDDNLIIPADHNVTVVSKIVKIFTCNSTYYYYLQFIGNCRISP